MEEDMAFFSGILASEFESNFKNFSLMLHMTKYLLCHDNAVDPKVRAFIARLIKTPKRLVDYLILHGEALKESAEYLKASPGFMEEISDLVSSMKPENRFDFDLVQKFMREHGQSLNRKNHHEVTDFYAKVILLCREAALKKAGDCILKILKEASDFVARTGSFPNGNQLYRCYLAEELCSNLPTA